MVQGRPDGSVAQLRAAALDLHEGISHPHPKSGTGCDRWPEHLRLLNEATGELVQGRCRATNLCRYCQRLYVVETVEMLTLDALEYAPTLWLVLTSREHLTRRDTYKHLECLRRAARKRWPLIEWFVQVEFQRRGALHLNLLIKGVPVADLADLHAVLVGRWCARVDALPVAQWSGEISDARGVVGYVSKMLAHGLKAEQAPPLGWRGHRTSQTRGYLVRPASVMRQEARAALSEKRLLHRAFEQVSRIFDTPEPDSDLVEVVFEQLDATRRDDSWRMVQLEQLSRDPARLQAEAARRPFRSLHGAS